MNQLELAIEIALKAHKGQLDKDGYPVILHPLTVGLMGNTDEEKITGFLHDVVEDSDITLDELRNQGIHDGIVNALDILTHKENCSYQDYIDNIIASGNPIALQVKHNDLKHNFARGKAYPDLQSKHGKALQQVEEAIKKLSEVGKYEMPTNPSLQTAIFAGGCFWGVQHQFEKEPGVLRTLVGYTGGAEDMPTYEEVRNHQTHHVEAVIVEFDPQKTDYKQLCKVFFEIHDPAQTDGVGPDIGAQYRSCIFFTNEQQQQDAMEIINLLRSKGYEVNTLLLPATTFWTGEEYHQRYYEKTGGTPYCHIRTKKF